MAWPETPQRSPQAAGSLRIQQLSWMAGVLVAAVVASVVLATSVEAIGARIGLVALVVAIAGGLLYWLAGRMLAPLNELLEATQQIAGGDLSIRAPSSDTEIGRIGRYFNVLVDRQRVTVGQVEGSRKKLEKLLGSLPLEISLFDSKGRYLYHKLDSSAPDSVNARLAVGMTPMELCEVGAGVPSVAGEIEAAIARCMEKNEPTSLQGATGRLQDHRDFVRVFTPVDASPNDAVRVVGYGVDVSEQKKAEAQLRERDEQLRRAKEVESIGRLAGGVAKDFDDIASTILESVGLALGAEGLPPEAKTDLERVQDGAQKAKILTSQLLAFGRKQVLRPERVDVGHLVRESEMMFRRLIGRHIRVESEHADHTVLIDVDPSKLEQVLMRLVLNARDAMSEGGCLSLSTRVERLTALPAGATGDFAPGPYAVITVADTGPGMDPATLGRIFEPFFTTNTATSGRGLGLSAVEGTISQSGGLLSVESQVGVGTTFRIFFPCVGESGELTPPTNTTPSPQGHGTIVVAAKDELLREFMRRALERAGFAVLTATDGNGAINTTRDHEGAVDVFLADVELSDMAVADVMRVVSSFRPDLRVVPFATSISDVVAHQPALGAVVLLQEPFESADLLKAVEGALGEAVAGGST